MRRRSGAGDIEDEEHSYLASVSDLMAGLLFVFIITLVVFAFQLSRTRAELTTEIDRIKSVPSVRMQMLEALKTKLEELDLTVEVVPDQGILRLTERGIYFPTGEEKPATNYAENVGKLAFVLMEVLPRYGVSVVPAPPPSQRPPFCYDRMAFQTSPRDADPAARLETVLVEGHTDPRPVRSVRFHDNWELSGARAAEVFRMMTQCEPGLATMLNSEKLRLVSVSGYAATRPADSADPISERNRRIDLRFMLLPVDSRFEAQPVPDTRRRLQDAG